MLPSIFTLVSAHGYLSFVPAPPRAYYYEGDLRGGKLAVFLIQHVGWFGLASLDEQAPTFSASRVPDVPEKWPKTLK